MSEHEAQRIFSCALDIGETMLRSGGEVYRVEDTITRLLKAYGASSTHVFSIPSNIIVTAVFDGSEITHTRRVLSVDTNLELLHNMNDLARKICAERPSPERLEKMIGDAKRVKRYNACHKLIIYALISASFAVFFKGSWLDALSSAIISVILYYTAIFARRAGGNLVFQDILCASVAAFFAVLCVKIGLANDADKVIIGNVMLLIPGVELVNGMRDFIAGDIQAGIMHVTEALFLAVAIALGAAGVLTLRGGGHI